MKSPVVIPDLAWYTDRSRTIGLLPRCPFANVEKCPRYYYSLSLMGGAGSTPIDESEDKKLLTRWKKSHLRPRTIEQDTGVTNKGFSFSNFCPEILFERFGYFADYLANYSDEIDHDSAVEQLGRSGVDGSDWRWHWASCKPLHYSGCSLYSVLTHDSLFRTKLKSWIEKPLVDKLLNLFVGVLLLLIGALINSLSCHR